MSTLASHDGVRILGALLIYKVAVVNAQFVSKLVPYATTKSLLLHLLNGTTAIRNLRIGIKSLPRHRIVNLFLEMAQLSKGVLR